MYIDPGLGSLMIQFGVAALAVVGASFAIFRTKIKNLFKMGKSDTDKDNVGGEPDDNMSSEADDSRNEQ